MKQYTLITAKIYGSTPSFSLNSAYYYDVITATCCDCQIKWYNTETFEVSCDDYLLVFKEVDLKLDLKDQITIEDPSTARSIRG